MAATNPEEREAAKEAFERHWREHPESKLELIDGRLVVGNSLAGSRYVLRDILRGWRTQAALAPAPLPLWRQAIRDAFVDLAPPSPDALLDAWKPWASRVEFEPAVAPAGPRSEILHHAARSRLTMDLWGLHPEDWMGIGPDFVLRPWTRTTAGGASTASPAVFFACLASKSSPAVSIG